MVKRKPRSKIKVYTTYANLFSEKGKKLGKKYPVQIRARSQANAIKRAKAYHKSWNKFEKKEEKGEFTAKYVGIKRR